MRLLSGKSVSPNDVRPRVLKDRECGAFHYIFRISPNPQKVERSYLVSISKTLHPSGTSNHTTIFAKHGGGVGLFGCQWKRVTNVCRYIYK